MSFNTYTTNNVNAKDLHQLIIGAVNPRPIAFVSSLDQAGRANLAPYSFFNAISSNPPLLVFSVATPSGTRAEKDTLKNISLSRECVINTVSYEIMRQMSLCSVNFDHGISEFEKSGLESLASHIVKAPRVKLSPVQFECTIRDILVYGNKPGSANLVVCEVQAIHVDKNVMMGDKLRYDSRKLDLVGRLGRSEYVRVQGDSIFEMYQPVEPVCLGVDQLPLSVRTSRVLSGADLAELASCTELPTKKQLSEFMHSSGINSGEQAEYYHVMAKKMIALKKKYDALIIALIPEFKL